MSRPEISEEEVIALMNAVKKRYDIDFTNYEPKSLTRGVARLIQRNKCNSLLDLWGKILQDREFFMGCIDDLTVNLTELFRNPEIWVTIRDQILPTLKDKPTINIWHAGCSSGEEVLHSLGIVLQQAGLLHKRKVLATDLSNTILKQAQNGIYSGRLFKKYLASYLRYFPKGNLEDFFVFNGDEVRIQDALKQNVTFDRHNLVHDPMNKKFDVILCRNVMIYFDDALKMKVLKLFHHCLEDDGFFLVGYYDILPDAYKELFTIYNSVERIYKKRKLS